MPKTTKTNPVPMHLAVSQELEDSLKALATRKKLSVAELSRRLLTQGISRDAANDATATIEAMVRRVVRKELAATHDLAFRAAYNAICAASMVRAIWLSPANAWPLSQTEADALEGEIRQHTAKVLRKTFELPTPDEDDEDQGV
jgi:hypothetical protein